MSRRSHKKKVLAKGWKRRDRPSLRAWARAHSMSVEEALAYFAAKELERKTKIEARYGVPYQGLWKWLPEDGHAIDWGMRR